MGTEAAKNTPSQEQMPDKGRRDTLKTLATVPILGALAYGVYQKRKDMHNRPTQIGRAHV